VAVVVTHLILQQIEMGLTVAQAVVAALGLVALVQELEAQEILQHPHPPLIQMQTKAAMVALLLKLVVLGVLAVVEVVHHK
jgi:hypothetical protein